MSTAKELQIVIADDDQDDQSLIREVFSDLNGRAQLHSVYNGLELMKWLQTNHRPDIIVMDLNMPLLNGLGALTKLKESERFKTIPVYVLSTSRFEYDRQKARELGAADFYTKPYNYQDLRTLIREIYETTLHGRTAVSRNKC